LVRFQLSATSFVLLGISLLLARYLDGVRYIASLVVVQIDTVVSRRPAYVDGRSFTEGQRPSSWEDECAVLGVCGTCI
jgi:hypothetical protein